MDLNMAGLWKTYAQTCLDIEYVGLCNTLSTLVMFWRGRDKLVFRLDRALLLLRHFCKCRWYNWTLGMVEK